MRWIVLLAATLLLGACNQVISQTPLFTAADATGAPVLKDGLWLTDDPGCRVDVRKPAHRWPRCAKWQVVRGGEILNLNIDDDGDSPASWVALPFLLAAGEPRIMQMDSGELMLAESKPSRLYMYLALAPIGQDSEGRITAFRAWPVLCGPPPLDKKGKPDPLFQTDAPFPGMTLLKGQTDKDISASCTADGPEAVRAAAAASQTFEPIHTERWIRDSLP